MSLLRVKWKFILNNSTLGVVPLLVLKTAQNPFFELYIAKKDINFNYE